jgi:cysteine synthase
MSLLPAKTLVRTTPTRFKQLKHMIGNTPLLTIRFSFRGKERVIYAKAEYLNMTGSIKDRMAFHILKKGMRRGANTIRR